MSDADFLASFEAGSLSEFRHRDHIRISWLYLQRDGFADGPQRIAAGIRRFAEKHGAAAKYNEALTQQWIRLVAALMAADVNVNCFDDFARAHPEVFDKGYALAFDRSETPGSSAAKVHWVEPALEQLP